MNLRIYYRMFMKLYIYYRNIIFGIMSFFGWVIFFSVCVLKVKL